MKVEHSLSDKTLHYITGKGSPLHKDTGSTSNAARRLSQWNCCKLCAYFRYDEIIDHSSSILRRCIPIKDVTFVPDLLKCHIM